MAAVRKKTLRCAIYTRKSSEEGLEQSFNSLDAQREACAAYVESQRHEGWKLIDTLYDDGGYSGGNVNRPALTRLLEDIDARRIDVVVVYKVDRLTRSLGDFAKIVERFDARGVSFVSVTQQFNTTSSMGRLTLNVLLSFAQFEREVTGERIRDKIAASKRKGMWMGGVTPLGYDLKDRKLVPYKTEAGLVNRIFTRYLKLGCVMKLKAELDAQGVKSKVRKFNKGGRRAGGAPYSRGALYHILRSPIYRGHVPHKDQSFEGEHPAIINTELWNKVQARLAANNQDKRNGAKAQSPSILAGLLYDDRGNRLTPSHTARRGKRYRYYVSQALIQGQSDRRGCAARIPAHDIESLVGRRLCAFLSSAQEVRDALKLPADNATTQRALITAAKIRSAQWSKTAPSELRAFLAGVILRIVLTDESTRIQLDKARLRSVLLDVDDQPSAEHHPTAEEDMLTLSIDAQIRRNGGATRLIVPSSAPGETQAQPNAALIKAIARAHRWYEQLTTGIPLTEIAKENGVNETYINHIVRLVFLAPDIVEAVLNGRQPVHLTVDSIAKLPSTNWNEQRRLWNFRASPNLSTTAVS